MTLKTNAAPHIAIICHSNDMLLLPNASGSYRMHEDCQFRACETRGHCET